MKFLNKITVEKRSAVYRIIYTPAMGILCTANNCGFNVCIVSAVDNYSPIKDKRKNVIKDIIRIKATLFMHSSNLHRKVKTTV